MRVGAWRANMSGSGPPGKGQIHKMGLEPRKPTRSLRREPARMGRQFCFELHAGLTFKGWHARCPIHQVSRFQGIHRARVARRNEFRSRTSPPVNSKIGERVVPLQVGSGMGFAGAKANRRWTVMSPVSCCYYHLTMLKATGLRHVQDSAPHFPQRPTRGPQGLDGVSGTEMPAEGILATNALLAAAPRHLSSQKMRPFQLPFAPPPPLPGPAPNWTQSLLAGG